MRVPLGEPIGVFRRLFVQAHIAHIESNCDIDVLMIFNIGWLLAGRVVGVELYCPRGVCVIGTGVNGHFAVINHVIYQAEKINYMRINY